MYITKIKVNKVRHLKDFEINLGEKKKHLILTGKNGSGKTSLLNEIEEVILYHSSRMKEEDKIKKRPDSKKIYDKLEAIGWEKTTELNLEFNNYVIKKEELIFGKYEAKRNLKMNASKGVELVKLDSIRRNRIGDMQKQFLKYMVHLKTQLMSAMLDNANEEVKKLEAWFDRFENVLRLLFENESLELVYDRKKYNFLIREGEKEFDFNQLSDGFSSIIDIFTGIMMQMEKDDELIHDYDMEGIVLIDEIDTHLHISLQKKILKVLDKFFPNIQFIVTTHSPFILNSISNAVIYDLEKQIQVEDMSAYPYEAISEVYFGTANYSDLIIEKINNFETLVDKKERSNDEELELLDLKDELTSVAPYLAKKLALKVWSLEERMS